MPFISDSAFDALIGIVDDADRLHICLAEPSSYANLTGTQTLGNKTLSSAFTGPADRSPTGRKTTVGAQTGGSVTATGSAAYWALALVGSSAVLASGALSSAQSVTNGNTFSTAAFDIGVPDAV
jgi:hypothetical protein